MRWRRYWWDDQLDGWGDECCRRAEETYEPSIQSGPVVEPDMDPRVDTVWDEMREDRLVRRGLEG